MLSFFFISLDFNDERDFYFFPTDESIKFHEKPLESERRVCLPFEISENYVLMASDEMKH